MHRHALIAAAATLALLGSSVPADAQVADGSVGTVQVATAPIDVAVTTADGTVAAVVPEAPAPPPGGAQSTSSSVGTVQIAAPQVSTAAKATPSTDGASLSPDSSVTAAARPAAREPQQVERSAGTAQIGGGAGQTARESAGSIQVAEPNVRTGASIEGPLRPDMPDSLVLPRTTLHGAVEPSAGGAQRADDSAGTVQIGSGRQEAADSAGTSQTAVPAAGVTASNGTEPSATGLSAGIAATGAGQDAERSTGTLQLGHGDQSSVGSAGTSQLALPSLGGSAGETIGATASPGSGAQTSSGSVGVLQLGAGSPSSAPTGSSLVQAGGAPVVGATPYGPTGASSTRATVSDQGAAAPTADEAPTDRTLAAAGSGVLSEALPLSGLALTTLLLAALVLVAAGRVLRHGPQPSA